MESVQYKTYCISLRTELKENCCIGLLLAKFPNTLKSACYSVNVTLFGYIISNNQSQFLYANICNVLFAISRSQIV